MDSNEHLLFKQKYEISLIDRQFKNKHKSAIVWLTGLSGSGKSSISIDTEYKLFNLGYSVCILDGDNLRLGLNRDLGFSDNDRKENIRRAAEVACVLYQAGFIVICSFISPFTIDREFARSLIPENRFFEIYIKCSMAECIKRDPKKLYERAINNDINHFTGISSRYEIPTNSHLIIDTENTQIDKSSDEIIGLLKKFKII